MGLFVYTQKGSIISAVDLPTTEIIESFFSKIFKKLLTVLDIDDRIMKLSREGLLAKEKRKKVSKSS